MKESGPDHDKKFVVGVFLGDQNYSGRRRFVKTGSRRSGSRAGTRCKKMELIKIIKLIKIKKMLTIRLTRKGKKNQPFFRVVLVDKRRSSTGGRAVEDLGYMDPLKKRRSFKAERIKYWISKGAQTSVTIHNLLGYRKNY